MNAESPTLPIRNLWTREMLFGLGVGAISVGLLLAWLYWGRTTQLLIATTAGCSAVLLLRYPTILSAIAGFIFVSHVAKYVPGSTSGFLIFTVGMLVVRRLVSGDVDWRLGWIFVAALGFSLWLASSALWSASLYPVDWTQPWRLMLVVIVLADLVSSPSRYIAYFIGGAIGLIFTSILAIQTAYEFYASGFAEQIANKVSSIESTRFYGNWPDPNIMSITLATFLGVTFAFWRSKLNFWIRSLAFLATSLAFIAILLSLSRAGLIACVIIIGMVLPIERRRFLVSTAVAAIVVLVVSIAPTDIFGRAIGLLEGDQSSGERLRLITTGWELFWKHPVLGGGMGSYESNILFVLTYLQQWMFAHNTIVDIAVDLGLIGIVLFAVAIYVAYRGLDWKRWRIDHSNPAHLMNAGLRASLIATTFSIMTMTTATYVPFWAFYTVCAMFSVTCLRDESVVSASSNSI